MERFVNGKVSAPLIGTPALRVVNVHFQVQKTTQFIATKEPSGQCFQLCSPCSMNFKLAPVSLYMNNLTRHVWQIMKMQTVLGGVWLPLYTGN